MKKLFNAALTTLTLSLSLLADLTLPTVFTDHVVLQREQSVPVWGTGDPGSTITVDFAGQKKTAVADADGKWRVDLDPLKASAQPQTLQVSNLKFQVSVSDVLVGDVWLCSGQSNMEMPMQGWRPRCPLENSDAEIAGANNPRIRLYQTPKKIAAHPTGKIDARWNACTPESVKTFSACAYYFGKKLNEELDVPIGLLLSAWGGSRIEPWTPPCGFEGLDSLADIREKVKNFPDGFGTDPKKVNQERQYPTALYNAMIHAHIPFAIKGAIWYQGEANHRDNMLYVDKTAALLKGWRGLWGTDFPFYFVQIAPYQYGNEDPSILAEFWEAQAAIVDKVPGTGMAVISDVTILDNIHPANKKTPGTRLALLALNNTYGKKVVSTGPTFKAMKKPLFGGNSLEIVFDSAEGLTTRDGKAPDCFEIGGEEGVFKPANAEIKGSSVILSSPDVDKPLAMRFAWNKLATPNLMNAAGLPAPAFRAGELPKPKAPGLTQIPEMKDYRIVYQLMIDADANFSASAPLYEIDNSAEPRPFSKIAYLLELKKSGGDVEYAFASMDAFTDDLRQISVPTAAGGARFMQPVKNLTVRSSVPGLQPVTGSDGGNIEFWPGNYTPANKNSIPGASRKFDFGDAGDARIPGYGCMQVHNWKDRQTVFAINRWGTGGTVDIGIGNSPGEKASDWTFAGNAGEFFIRRLTIMVK